MSIDDLISKARFGLFGRQAFRWVNGENNDWKRLAFLIGSVVLIFVIIVLWHTSKLMMIGVLLAYTILFGYRMSAAVLIVTAGLLVFSLFSSLGGAGSVSPGANSQGNKPVKEFDKIVEITSARNALDGKARKYLDVQEYERFRVSFDLCSSREALESTIEYWEIIFNARSTE